MVMLLAADGRYVSRCVCVHVCVHVCVCVWVGGWVGACTGEKMGVAGMYGNESF